MIFYVGTKLLEWRFLISSNRITEVLFDNSTALNSAMQRATKNFIEYFCVSLMQPKTVKKTDSSHKHTKRWKAHAFERQFAIGATSRTYFWHFDRCSISAHKNHLPNFFSFISVVSFVFHFCCENTFCSSSSAAQWISFPSYLPSIKWMWIKRIVSDRIFNWSKSCFFLLKHKQKKWLSKLSKEQHRVLCAVSNEVTTVREDYILLVKRNSHYFAYFSHFRVRLSHFVVIFN